MTRIDYKPPSARASTRSDSCTTSLRPFHTAAMTPTAPAVASEPTQIRARLSFRDDFAPALRSTRHGEHGRPGSNGTGSRSRAGTDIEDERTSGQHVPCESAMRRGDQTVSEKQTIWMDVATSRSCCTEGHRDTRPQGSRDCHIRWKEAVEGSQNLTWLSLGRRAPVLTTSRSFSRARSLLSITICPRGFSRDRSFS